MQLDTMVITFAGVNSGTSPRHFFAREGLSTLFEVVVTVRSPDEDLGLEVAAGQDAWFRIECGGLMRLWSGVCSRARHTAVEPGGLSTYEITIVPRLWLLTRGSDYRIFQHLSVPEIARRLLEEWHIEHVFRLDASRYPRLEQRVQYGETDYDFLCRLLEEAGITYSFEPDLEKGSILILADEPHARAPQLDEALPFLIDPDQAHASDAPWVTEVVMSREVRAGRRAVRDFDFRHPDQLLLGEVADGQGVEANLEEYYYRPGASVVEFPAPPDPSTPFADKRGAARHDERELRWLAKRSLRAHRGSGRKVSFETNVMNLMPGAVIGIGGHPHEELAGKPLLIVATSLEGEANRPVVLQATVVFADRPYRPPQITPRPVVAGVQSALVAGPVGAEIHTDEFGRVRLQFPWDRGGRGGKDASCWARVAQGWAGPGYGLFTSPRVGHEVLVGFFEGDPDQPVVMGRVYNGVAKHPRPLPERSTLSAWTSASSPEPAGPGAERGSNVIALDDARGAERLVMRAERDLASLVKRNEVAVVGGDAHGVVGRDERIAVRRASKRMVLGSEQETIGGNQRIGVIGGQQSAIALRDTRRVGLKFAVKIIPEIGARLGDELEALEAQTTAAVQERLPVPAPEVIAPVLEPPLPPAPPTHAEVAAAWDRVVAERQALDPEPVRRARELRRAREAFVQPPSLPPEPSPPPAQPPALTEAMMPTQEPAGLILTNNCVRLRTSGAELMLDGADVKLGAKGNIYFLSNQKILTSVRINETPGPSTLQVGNVEVTQIQGSGQTPENLVSETFFDEGSDTTSTESAGTNADVSEGSDTTSTESAGTNADVSTDLSSASSVFGGD
jgi:type VI secretion system secreted protein VgrG